MPAVKEVGEPCERRHARVRWGREETIAGQWASASRRAERDVTRANPEEPMTVNKDATLS